MNNVFIRSAILELYKQVKAEKKVTPEFKRIASQFDNKRKKFEESLMNMQKNDLDDLFLLNDDMYIQEIMEYFVERFYIRSKTIYIKTDFRAQY